MCDDNFVVKIACRPCQTTERVLIDKIVRMVNDAHLRGLNKRRHLKDERVPVTFKVQLQKASRQDKQLFVDC